MNNHKDPKDQEDQEDQKYYEFVDNENKNINKTSATLFIEVENEYSKHNLDKTLNDNLFAYVELERSSGINSLSGKQRRIGSDIALRFFKNYLATGALFVFITILLISLIAPLVSPFTSNRVVLTLTPEFISNLPPSYAPIVSEILTISQRDNVLSILGESAVEYRELTPGGDWLVTYDKYALINKTLAQIPNNKITSFSTLLGTTQEGFDIWTRTWTATRDSLTLSILVAMVETIIGTVIGAYIGFHAGTWVDTFFTRLIDIIRNVPSIIWFLLLISLFNELNFGALFLSLILIGWVTPVYQTRLWMITVKDQEYILASKSIGASTNRQIFIHALPAIVGKLATAFVWRIVIVIFFISSLAFLGFIPYGGEPNLGTILNEARGQVENNVWILLLPALILLFISLSTQFIANGLHDALDPKVGGNK